MIYIATVHWKDAKWINIQDKMLNRFVVAPYKKFGFLNDVDKKHYASFDLVRDDPDDPAHQDKLNILATDILADSRSDDDWMIFLDGDAFPISDVVPQISALLKSVPLVAVQRLENLGERQPHPCFCVTTVGTWKQIGGTWIKGFKWTNSIGREVTDVGGELLGILTKRKMKWKPLHRSNTLNLHPLLYAVYADLIYHQGAGFRFHGNSIDYYRFGHYGLWYRIQAGIIDRLVPGRYLTSVRLSMFHPMGRMYRRVHEQNDDLYAKMYARIEKEEQCIYELIEPREVVENRYDGWEKLAKFQSIEDTA